MGYRWPREPMWNINRKREPGKDMLQPEVVQDLKEEYGLL